MFRTRPTVLAALLSAAFLTLAEPAHAGDVRWQPELLARPQGMFYSYANAINSLGQVAGQVGDGTYQPGQAAVWSADGQLTLLQPGSSTYSSATAINNLGQVAGFVRFSADIGDTQAATWVNGGNLVLLPGGGRPGSSAAAINDNGLVVGSVIAANGYQHAAVWRNGQLTDLGATTLNPDAFSTASGVNRHDSIVGTGQVRGSTSGHVPLTWQPGPNGSFLQEGSYSAVAINDLGQVLANRTDWNGQAYVTTPMLISWDGQVTAMVPEGTDVFYNRLNNAGQATGYQFGAGPSVWSSSGGAVTVNSRLVAGSPYAISTLSDINDLGQMVGYATGQGAVRLTPTGTLDYVHPGSWGFLNEASNWDSGLGFAPNRFLDARITGNGSTRDVIGTSYDLVVKSMLVGGGSGLSRLVLIESGRLTTLDGLRLVNGGRLSVAAGSDATYATGHAGGLLHAGAGSGIELRAARPEAGSFDRLEVDGTLLLDGATFFLDMTGAPPAQLGDSYDFLDWGTLDGSFAELVLPALDAGLRWDTSRLYTDGVLSVGAVPEPGTWALLLAGGMALTRRLRTRR